MKKTASEIADNVLNKFAGNGVTPYAEPQPRSGWNRFGHGLGGAAIGGLGGSIAGGFGGYLAPVSEAAKKSFKPSASLIDSINRTGRPLSYFSDKSLVNMQRGGKWGRILGGAGLVAGGLYGALHK